MTATCLKMNGIRAARESCSRAFGLDRHALGPHLDRRSALDGHIFETLLGHRALLRPVMIIARARPQKRGIACRAALSAFGAAGPFRPPLLPPLAGRFDLARRRQVCRGRAKPGAMSQKIRKLLQGKRFYAHGRKGLSASPFRITIDRDRSLSHDIRMRPTVVLGFVGSTLDRARWGRPAGTSGGRASACACTRILRVDRFELIHGGLHDRPGALRRVRHRRSVAGDRGPAAPARLRRSLGFRGGLRQAARLRPGLPLRSRGRGLSRPHHHRHPRRPDLPVPADRGALPSRPPAPDPPAARHGRTASGTGASSTSTCRATTASPPASPPRPRRAARSSNRGSRPATRPSTG